MWRLAAGMLRSADLPSMAADALVRGLDSPSLRELAGQSPRDALDNRDLFVAVIDELGLVMPSELEALWNLSCATASDIASGAVEPYAGAMLIWRMDWDRLDRRDELSDFIGLASMWQEQPGDRPALEAEIVEYAREFLARVGTPSSRTPGPQDASE